jgi:ABC-type multidrug transport system permease subunit
MTRPLQTILRAIASIITAWLLWGAVLNGASYIADSAGRDSSIGSAFAGVTFWLGHFGFGILFFVIVAAVLFILSGAVANRSPRKA